MIYGFVMDSTSLNSIPDLEKGINSSDRSASGTLSQASTAANDHLSTSRKLVKWNPWSSNNDPNRKPKIRKVEDERRGYRSLSTFLDSDQNFMLYRRYGYLNSRILLRKQDRLRKPELELDECDDLDAEVNTNESRKLLMSRDSDEAADHKEAPETRTRTQILDEIELALENYKTWVLNARQMVALNKPAVRDYNSVEAYIYEKKPLIDEESGFIYMKEDLITLRDGRETAVLDSFIEKFLQVFHCSWLQYLFCTKEDRRKTTDPNLHYYSKSRKTMFITTILILVLLCLLILPVFILYRLTSQHSLDVTYTVDIGVLLVFTLAFSAILSLFTQAKRHEIFGAAAA
ncbi:hypothetical protein PVAG01_08956 [Phlyctema vagabunda]|uniref:DUF6594 domain-containing protein n=1 Tax=Phlyctema vagabunda TaxID=108571 RepID=A0ABR4PBC3_9HELO